MQDHLGNTRVVFGGHSNGQPEVMQITDYYPFGMVMNQQNYFADGVLDNKYLYNGKELQDDELAGNSLGWYDYGKRFYDPALARWHSVDPMAESYYSHSPFHFSGNNPMRFLDLNGMNYNDYKLNQDGSITLVEITNSKTDDLYATNSDGSINKDKSISVTKGTFINPIRNEANPDTRGFRTDNVGDAKKIFKFSADNSTIEGGNPMEFAIVNFEKDGISEAVVVTDGKGSEVSGTKIARSFAKEGAEIKEVTHNHPRGTQPSGYTRQGTPDGMNRGDFRNAGLVNRNGSKINLNVYSSQKNTIFNYDKNGYVAIPSVFYFGY